MLNRWFLILALAALGLTLLAFGACYRNADDDDNDTSQATDDDATDDDDAIDDDAVNAPPIPHGNQGDNCLGCHATRPGFPHGSTYTNDDCLNCHQYQ